MGNNPETDSPSEKNSDNSSEKNSDNIEDESILTTIFNMVKENKEIFIVILIICIYIFYNRSQIPNDSNIRFFADKK